MADDQRLEVMQCVPLPHLLNHLPQHLHRTAILAHVPSAKASNSLCLVVRDPHSTSHIAQCMPSFTALTALSFRPFKDLNDEQSISSLTQLQLLPQLSSLDVSGMQLTATACAALRDCINSLPQQLSSLNISRCSLTPALLRIFLTTLKKHPNLQQLDLSDNRLYSEDCMVLTNHFSTFEHLTSLKLARVWLLKFPDSAAFARCVQPTTPRLHTAMHVNSVGYY